MTKNAETKKRGPPVKNKIEKINASAKEIAKAMFRAADYKRDERIRENVWFRI